MRTQVAIIGGGPAGLLLAQVLRRNNIDNVVLERQSRNYVLGRVRAGLLEWGTVEVLRSAGVGARLDSQGMVHDDVALAVAGRDLYAINTQHYAKRRMMAYGQTQITEDLYAANDAANGHVIHNVDDVQLHEIDSSAPSVSYVHDGKRERIECDYIAGCDGFHGISRTSIPVAARQEFEKVFPFSWLGILSETPPCARVTYANSERGFALASMRSPMLSRYYIQCDLDTDLAAWSDERFWDELRRRFPKELAETIVTGPSIEKSIAPLRSYVCEPMCFGRLFLAGDAAHIVPPTGAKGLNLAVSDVFYLSRGLIAHYQDHDSHYLERYSDMALKRVWNAVRFSYSLTNLLHRFPDQSAFEQKIKENELEFLVTNESAKAALSIQYAGLPLET